MLSRIRQGLNSFLVLLLMGLLIASFAVWGIGDVFRSSGTTVLAEVGGEEVTVVAFQRRLDNLVRDNQARNPDFTVQSALASGLDRQLLGAMIQGAAVDAAAKKLGIRASDDQVRREIAALPAFQIAGQFDMNTYRFALESSGMSEKALFEGIRQDLTRDMVLNAVGRVADAPATMANSLFRFLREKREATIVTVPETAVGDIAAPDGETLRAYFEDNSERYQAPEYRSFDYGILSADSLVQGITVDDAAVAAAYDRRRGEYVSPELRRLEQVVFTGQADAQTFHDRMNAGGDFAALAQEQGFDADDLALGDLSHGDVAADYGDAIADTVFALDEGAVSAPVQSPFGWHVFHVTRVEAGEGQSLDDVREELRRTLAQEQSIDLLYEKVNEIEDAFATGSTLPEVLGDFGIALNQAELVARTGEQKSGGNIADYQRIEPLLEDAFAQQLGDEPLLVPMGDTAYGVIQLRAVEPARALTFEEVRDRVAADWLAAEKRRRNRALAEALVQRAQGGEDLVAIAQQAGYPVVEDVAMERQTVLQPGGAASAAGVLFGLAEGGMGVAPSSAGTAFMVVRNDNTVSADPSSDPDYLAALRGGLARVIGTDFQQQYIAEQQRKHGITVNEQLWQTLRTQLGAPS